MSAFSNLRMEVDIQNYVNTFKFMWNLHDFCTFLAFIYWMFTGANIFQTEIIVKNETHILTQWIIPQP